MDEKVEAMVWEPKQQLDRRMNRVLGASVSLEQFPDKPCEQRSPALKAQEDDLCMAATRPARPEENDTV